MTSGAKRSLGALGGARRQVAGASGEWVDVAPLVEGGEYPLVARPQVDGVDLADWASANRGALAAHVDRAGAILFRGFGVDTPAELDRAVAAIAGRSLEYRDRSSPRSQVEGNVYTSTDHPPDQPIFLHNEQSYSSGWPSRIAFCCVTPAAEGGQTPIADCRRVYRAIDPVIRARFEELGVMYVRNFGHGFGLSWQTAFQTDDPAEVARLCAESGIEVEWRGDGRLRTRHVRPAAVRHPATGEPVWFNHGTFFHVSTLPEHTRDILRAQFAEEDLPYNSYYGDGSSIEDDTAAALRQAYRGATVSFDWEQGDLLLLDNMLIAHGRAAYSGPRKVLVAMAAPLTWSDVDLPGGAPVP